jgi:hypothetical protein
MVRATLLIARWHNGTDMLSIVNSRTLEVTRGFYGVPSGHTMVGGWIAQNRTAIELADVNGDGSQELVSVTNGVWNRVTVFSAGGVPLYNAQFGPGPSNALYSTMRDLVVADLSGDGTMEIITATAGGLVVCFDHQLQPAVGTGDARWPDRDDVRAHQRRRMACWWHAKTARSLCWTPRAKCCARRASRGGRCNTHCRSSTATTGRSPYWGSTRASSWGWLSGE